MTSLTKKERGKLRYDKKQQHVKDERARAKRTRNSDISPPRYTDGMSQKGLPWIPRQREALTLAELDLLVQATKPKETPLEAQEAQAATDNKAEG